MPKIPATPIPLDYEQVGDIIVVTLRDNVGTLLQCQAVRRQLNSLVNEGHCDFVLDFLHAGRISNNFREVMLDLLQAARKTAVKLGKPCRPVPRPRGAVLEVFDDRKRAVEEMCKYDDRGRVVLCSVPMGIRAVAGLI